MSLTEGDSGVMLPTNDGHYACFKLAEAVAGQTALLYPAPAGEYYILDLADSTSIGSKIVAVPDSKGNYYGVSPG
jgi:hypothetical protein